MKNRFRSCAFILFLSCLVNSPFLQAAELKIVCGVAPYENIFEKIKDKYEKETKNTLKFIGDIPKNGADVSFSKVLSGEAEIGSAAIPIDGWLKIVKEKKLADDKQIGEITHRVLGKDLMKVFSHKDVGVTKLTLDQAKQIFTGEKKNWKDFGGKDVEIKIVLQSTYPATNTFFKTKIMSGTDFPKTVLNENSVPAMIEKVSKTPGGVGFVSNMLKTPDANTIETNEVIGRPITAIVKGKPSELAQAFFNFVAKEVKQ